MVGRTLVKGLVVVALTSQVAFGASYYEAASTSVKNAGSAVKTAVVNVAQNSYEASKNAAISAGKVVAAKATAAGKAVSTAAGHIRDGFFKAGMSLTEGPLKVWANHRDACIAGLTLTGVASVYAIYKYRKACAAQRQLEELKAQGYVKA